MHATKRRIQLSSCLPDTAANHWHTGRLGVRIRFATSNWRHSLLTEALPWMAGAVGASLCGPKDTCCASTGGAPEVHEDYVVVPVGDDGAASPGGGACRGALAEPPQGAYPEPAARLTLRNFKVLGRMLPAPGCGGCFTCKQHMQLSYRSSTKRLRFSEPCQQVRKRNTLQERCWHRDVAA